MTNSAAKTVSAELSPSAKALLSVLNDRQSGDFGPNREVSDAARRYNSYCRAVRDYAFGRPVPEFESFRSAANELSRLNLAIEEHGHIRVA